MNLNCRSCRTSIPRKRRGNHKETLLLSFKIVHACADLTKLQSRQKYYYDRANSKSIPPLREGDAVCCRKNKMWSKSVVSNVRNEPRSYLARNEHGELRTVMALTIGGTLISTNCPASLLVKTNPIP